MSDKKKARSALAGIARDLKERLAFERDGGLEALPAPPPKRAGPPSADRTPDPEAEGRAAPPASTSVAPGSPPPASPPPAEEGFFEPVVRVRSKDPAEALREIRATLGDCTRCKLHAGRTHLVFGTGDPRTDLVFVGEGPGRDEDLQGEPFVGRAGELLTKMILAMQRTRADVYICNVVKCRPPENRLPEPEEVATCAPFLWAQLQAIHPKVVVALGATALQTLLGGKASITRLRGTWQTARGFQVMPTYHPAYLLRNPPAKKEVWKDLQAVMARLHAPAAPPP